jgi:hypothetical protein
MQFINVNGHSIRIDSIVSIHWDYGMSYEPENPNQIRIYLCDGRTYHLYRHDKSSLETINYLEQITGYFSQ